MGQEQYDQTYDQDVKLKVSPAEEGDKLVGTILDGKIQIESLIGQGGMSVVYQGTHMVLNRKMAVKVLLPNLGMSGKAVLRLQQEAKAAFSLSHENLASVHDVAVTSDGLPYLVMDFAEGDTLSAMIRYEPIKAGKAIDIFLQICAGLKAAHSQGVIHRDIKPGNIMVEDLGNRVNVKVVDFGIAKKVTENAEEIQKLTQTGEVFGTPLYMSPEQCRGEKIDERSDIYSLGCVLYEALTGTAPFVGDSSIATIMLHLGKEPPQPPKNLGIPGALINVVHKCLEKNPKNRYQTMDELQADLQRIKDGGKTKNYKRKRAVSKGAKAGLVLLSLPILGVGYYLYEYITNYDFGYRTIEECNEKLANNPNDFKGYYRRGQIFIRNQEWTKAVADFSDALKLKNDAFSHAQRAFAYNHLKKYDLAIADCNVQIGLEKNVAGYHNRSEAYLYKRDYKQALADAEKFLAVYPRDIGMNLVKAKALTYLGDMDKAKASCAEALRLSSNTSADAYTWMAYIDIKMKDYAACVENATKAITINRDAYAYTLRATANATLKNYDQAIADMDKLSELNPNDLSCYKNKAKWNLRLANYEAALEANNEWIKRDGENPSAYLYRATIYQALQNPTAMKADLARNKELEAQKAKAQAPEGQSEKEESEDKADSP